MIHYNHYNEIGDNYYYQMRSYYRFRYIMYYLPRLEELERDLYTQRLAYRISKRLFSTRNYKDKKELKV